jgi:hypothetical protein
MLTVLKKAKHLFRSPFTKSSTGFRLVDDFSLPLFSGGEALLTPFLGLDAST